jgi:hypothetical protein
MIMGRPCLIGQLWSRTEGKPAVRNLRGDDGDVGIIRSPVRASILPNQRCHALAAWDLQPSAEIVPDRDLQFEARFCRGEEPVTANRQWHARRSPRFVRALFGGVYLLIAAALCTLIRFPTHPAIRRRKGGNCSTALPGWGALICAPGSLNCGVTSCCDT